MAFVSQSYYTLMDYFIITYKLPLEQISIWTITDKFHLKINSTLVPDTISSIPTWPFRVTCSDSFHSFVTDSDQALSRFDEKIFVGNRMFLMSEIRSDFGDKLPLVV